MLTRILLFVLLGLLPSVALAAQLPANDPKVTQARSLQRAGDYEGAAQAWRAVLETAPQSPVAWYNLGYSLHAAGKLEEALAAHETAAGFPAIEATARYNAACAHALLGDAEAAFAALERAIAAGFTNASLAQSDPDLESLRADERFAPLIESIGVPLPRALFFWVGEWDCYTPGGALSGKNDLVPRNGETVIHEIWQPVQGGPGGESWNYYDPLTRTWRQHWMSPDGTPFVYVGKPRDGGILFEGPHLDGKPSPNRKRMFIRPIGAGRVQQTGTKTSDGGTTWQPDFDLIYVPRGEAFQPGAGARPVAPQAPARQFDFLIGDWRMDVEQVDAKGERIRSLTEWSRVRPMIGGASLIDEWGGSGLTVRTWDPNKKVWRLFWTDQNTFAGRMQVWEGTFQNGVGTFVGGMSLPDGDGRIRSKIEFSEIQEDSLLWKMWKSPDNGQTWVLDYIRRYTRLDG